MCHAKRAAILASGMRLLEGGLREGIQERKTIGLYIWQYSEFSLLTSDASTGSVRETVKPVSKLIIRCTSKF